MLNKARTTPPKITAAGLDTKNGQNTGWLASYAQARGMSLNPNRVKEMTFKIYNCHYLAWCSALVGRGKDWFVMYQDNVCEWEIILITSTRVNQNWLLSGLYYIYSISYRELAFA